jgi:hypothetical protein
MATYHTKHPFQPGQLTQVWNGKKHEWQPSPHFCVVCGRKQDHVLHGGKK